MEHRHYCTYFDHRYLPSGLVLYASLARVSRSFTLWVLALDEQAASFLEAARLPSMRIVRLAALEEFDPELRSTRTRRSQVEYYFTCSPCLPRYLLTVHDVNEITYLDADLGFFSSPEDIFEEIGNESIAIVPHRLAGSAVKTHSRYGRYNVGWLTFRSDARGLACVDWWRKRCIEWCHDRVEEDRYADQKYLDRFEFLFEGVKVIQHPGANLAPWNVAGHAVTLSGGNAYVDGRKLIFFHFQGLRSIGPDTYDTNLTGYGASLTKPLRDGVFLPYISDLRAAKATVVRHIQPPDGTTLRRSGTNRWRLAASSVLRTLRARMAGNTIKL